MKQILTRLVLTLPVVWLVVSLVFLLIHLVPGDPNCRCWAKVRHLRILGRCGISTTGRAGRDAILHYWRA